MRVKNSFENYLKFLLVREVGLRSVVRWLLLAKVAGHVLTPLTRPWKFFIFVVTLKSHDRVPLLCIPSSEWNSLHSAESVVSRSLRE